MVNEQCQGDDIKNKQFSRLMTFCYKTKINGAKVVFSVYIFLFAGQKIELQNYIVQIGQVSVIN